MQGKGATLRLLPRLDFVIEGTNHDCYKLDHCDNMSLPTICRFNKLFAFVIERELESEKYNILHDGRRAFGHDSAWRQGPE